MKIRSTLLTNLAAGLFAAAVKLLFRTVRLSLRESTPGTNPYVKSPAERFFYCVWHDSMVIPAFAVRSDSAAALTSRHADGSFVAEVLRRVGMSTIRGSTSHIGPGAMRQLLRVTEDKHLVITPDGPRGPRRRMTTGIVFLASRTGRAVVPTACSCVRYWKIPGSWTDLIVPKPFTKVFLLGGVPIRVPPELKGSQLQPYVDQIQTEMDRLNETAELLSATAREGRRATSKRTNGSDAMVPVEKTQMERKNGETTRY
ncbi:MAG TPA: lysophospholipid acyltransferase family protein [Thermoguttaceae bacterium]|nr:lysophospholipid acyltransferase family protein [Thermoguttaceae bacterium]